MGLVIPAPTCLVVLMQASTFPFFLRVAARKKEVEGMEPPLFWQELSAHRLVAGEGALTLSACSSVQREILANKLVALQSTDGDDFRKKLGALLADEPWKALQLEGALVSELNTLQTISAVVNQEFGDPDAIKEAKIKVSDPKNSVCASIMLTARGRSLLEEAP